MTEDITAEVERSLNIAGVVTEGQIRALLARVREAEAERDVATSLYYTTESQLTASDERNAALREQLESANIMCVSAYGTTASQVLAENAALREQLAEREEAAFRAGWGLAGGVINKITLTTALAAWRASQKGTPT